LGILEERPSYYNITSCFKKIKFITADTKVKHTNISITTEIIKQRVFTKVIKMPS